MTPEEEMQKTVDEVVSSLKPVIEDFLKMINDLGFELNDDGDLVPIKGRSRGLKRRDDRKDE